MEREDHVREAGELEEHEEDELAGEVLPQQLAGPAVVELLLGLRALHGVHHQVHQLVLQNRAALLVLEGEARQSAVSKLGPDREGGAPRGVRAASPTLERAAPPPSRVERSYPCPPPITAGIKLSPAHQADLKASTPLKAPVPSRGRSLTGGEGG